MGLCPKPRKGRRPLTPLLSLEERSKEESAENRVFGNEAFQKQAYRFVIQNA